MNRVLLVLAMLAAITNPAKADTYAEMAQFAQAICGDIPEGNLTRTAIQGKVEANAGAFAKIFSGSGDVSGSRTEEIYKGIPFSKLPDKIPTVSMCKLELIKILLPVPAPPPVQQCSANPAAEDGARWVLQRDAGARKNYDAARAGGASRYSALMRAQGHTNGAGARAAFTAWGENCVDWYARQIGG